MKKLSVRTKNNGKSSNQPETVEQFLARQPNCAELAEIIRHQCEGLDEFLAKQPQGEELSKIIQRQNQMLKESNPDIYRMLFGEDTK